MEILCFKGDMDIHFFSFSLDVKFPHNSTVKTQLQIKEFNSKFSPDEGDTNLNIFKRFSKLHDITSGISIENNKEDKKPQ